MLLGRRASAREGRASFLPDGPYQATERSCVRSKIIFAMIIIAIIIIIINIYIYINIYIKPG